MTTKIAYGFQRDLPGFADLEPAQAGARLRAMGFDVAFMHGADAPWIEGLHAAGLRVYDSFGMFVGEEAWAQFPESRPVMADGQPAPREEWYTPVIPTLPALRAQRLAALDALARSAPIDGLWLDFIRWPARWERAEPNLYASSFDPVTLRQFQTDTGVTLPASADSPARAARWILAEAADVWHRWRCAQIVSFVEEARAALKRHRPDALLGMFVVPWTDADFDGANVRIVGQDLSLLAAHVDVFSPMVYHRLCQRDTAWVGRVSAWARTRSGGTVWPIIEALEPGDVYPLGEFASACRHATDASGGALGDGLMVFKLDGMLLDPARVGVWKEL